MELLKAFKTKISAYGQAKKLAEEHSLELPKDKKFIETSSYIQNLLAKKAVTVSKVTLKILNKNFDTPLGYDADALFYYFIYLMKSEKLAVEYLGFQKTMPEPEFLLKCIAIKFPDNSLIQGLPDALVFNEGNENPGNPPNQLNLQQETEQLALQLKDLYFQAGSDQINKQTIASDVVEFNKRWLKFKRLRDSHKNTFVEYTDKINAILNTINLEFQSRKFPLALRLLSESKITATFSELKKYTTHIAPVVHFVDSNTRAAPNIVLKKYPCFVSQPFRGVTKTRLRELNFTQADINKAFAHRDTNEEYIKEYQRQAFN